MRKYLLPLFCLGTIASVMASATTVLAEEPLCLPFEVTSLSTLEPVDEDTDMIEGEGTGQPIGEYTQSGEVTFVFQGGAILFLSTTTISAAYGDLYTAEFGSAIGGAGHFQIIGGTELYESAAGHGSFRVVAFDPEFAVQTVKYRGVLCLPAGD